MTTEGQLPPAQAYPVWFVGNRLLTCQIAGEASQGGEDRLSAPLLRRTTAFHRSRLPPKAGAGALWLPAHRPSG